MIVSDKELDESSLKDLHRFADYVGIGYSSEGEEDLRKKFRFSGIPA